jgi:hypothetical protein
MADLPARQLDRVTERALGLFRVHRERVPDGVGHRRSGEKHLLVVVSLSIQSFAFRRHRKQKRREVEKGILWVRARGCWSIASGRRC